MSRVTDIVGRTILAREHLRESLIDVVPMSDGLAETVTSYYLNHKLARLDVHIGRSIVKHGKLLDQSCVAAAIVIVAGKQLDCPACSDGSEMPSWNLRKGVRVNYCPECGREATP